MNWLTNFVKPKLTAIKSKIFKKESLWIKCSSCGQMNFHKDLQEKMYMCSNCDAHLAMPINERLASIYDKKGWIQSRWYPQWHITDIGLVIHQHADKED